jgi:hypothetical protein
MVVEEEEGELEVLMEEADVVAGKKVVKLEVEVMVVV